MIYFLGMSHVINVLKACSSIPLSFTHENWSALNTAGTFFNLPVKPGVLPEESLKSFIISTAAGWGAVADSSMADGKINIVAAPGFIDLLNSIQPVQDEGVLFAFINGNEHSVLSMVQHPLPYDFHLPWREDLELLPGRQPLPLEVITRQLEQALKQTNAILLAMRLTLPRIRLVLVMPPPPLASEESIRKVPEVFADQFEQFGITPLSIRLKYYLYYTEMLSQTARNSGIEILPVPPQALNPDGSLADPYTYGCTHGNEHYGALVAAQIKHVVQSDGDR